MQFGGVNVVPCRSLMWVEFRVGVMMRNENELESRNHIMEPALCRQKESELPSDGDGVPTEGYASGAMSSNLSFLKGETTLAAACRMDWRGARLETRRKK